MPEELRVLFSAFALLFVAELGDKTQLAVISMTAKHQMPLWIFIGAVLGGVLGNPALVAQPLRLAVGQQDAPFLRDPVHALLDLDKNRRVGRQRPARFIIADAELAPEFDAIHFFPVKAEIRPIVVQAGKVVTADRPGRRAGLRNHSAKSPQNLHRISISLC